MSAPPGVARARLAGIGLILLSSTSFGWMPVFARQADRAGATPETVLALRFAIAALGLALVVAWRRLPVPRGSQLLPLVAIGGVLLSAQSLCLFYGLRFASPGLVILLLYLYPTLVLVLSAVILRRRQPAHTWVALVVSTMGLLLAVGPLELSQWPGVVLGLGAAVANALYVLAGERILRDVSSLSACLVMFAAASLVLLGVAIVAGPVLPTGRDGWLAVVGLGVVSTLIAVVALFAGVSRLGAPTASVLSTFELVVTITLAELVLHDPLTRWQLVGGGLIAAAVVISARPEPARGEG